MNLKCVLLLILLAIFLPLEGRTQVEMFDIQPQDSTIYNIPKYDSLYDFEIRNNGKLDKYWDTKESLKRFIAENLFQFIGQTVYFYPMNTNDKSRGYPGTGLEDQYYVIDSIVPAITGTPGWYKLYNIRLDLHDQKTNTQKVFRISKDDLYFGWHKKIICVGYFEKLKELYEGKKMIMDCFGSNRCTLNSGSNEVYLSKGTELRCFKVGIAELSNDFYPYLFLEDSMGIQYKVRADNDKEMKKLCEKNEYIKKLEQEEIERKQAEEKAVLAKKQAEERAAQEAAEEQKRLVERKAVMVKKYGKYYGELIAEGKVVLGMTKEMCKESWGEPDDINVSIGSWGRHEQWVYEHYYSSDSYLYFENGKLTSIQN